MSDKTITLTLGGKNNFNVKKVIDEEGIERFEVVMGDHRYGGSHHVAGPGPWAEVMDALNGFRDEAAEAGEALVQVATLTATGAQEDSST